MVPDAVLRLLVCPVCHGSLRQESQEIVCLGCEQRYPVWDGIPVLVAGGSPGGTP